MIGNIPGDRDCPVRNKCVRLFQKYHGDELQLKIAEAIADEWLDMYKYVPFIYPKPKVALDYLSMTTIEKKNFDKENPEWHMSEEMKNYGFREDESVRTVASNKDFLENALHYLEKDAPRREKIRGVLAGYPNAKVRVEPVAAQWVD